MGVIFAGSAAAADEVTRAEAWFNKIKSIKADFVQVASDGTSAEGKLLFRRPSQMKIAFGIEDGGKGLQLITSKIWLHVDRPDEKQVVSYPLSETPLSLILAPKGFTAARTVMKRGSIHRPLALCRFLFSRKRAKGQGS